MNVPILPPPLTGQNPQNIPLNLSFTFTLDMKELVKRILWGAGNSPGGNYCSGRNYKEEFVWGELSVQGEGFGGGSTTG